MGIFLFALYSVLFIAFIWFICEPQTYNLKKRTAFVITGFGEFLHAEFSWNFDKYFLLSPLRHISGIVNLGMQKSRIAIEVKTKDGFLRRGVFSVEYKIDDDCDAEALYRSFCKLRNPEYQIPFEIQRAVSRRISETPNCVLQEEGFKNLLKEEVRVLFKNTAYKDIRIKQEPRLSAH